MNRQYSHIVFLTPGFPADVSDTTCIPALQVYAKRLQESTNCKVSVLAFQYPKKAVSYDWNGITVYPLGGGRWFSKPFLWQRAISKLKQLHAKTPIMAIHSFWLGECALIGHWFSQKNNRTHLVSLMGQDARRGNRYAWLLPLHKMKLVTLSRFHQTLFQKNYKIQSTCIPWGINPENFNHSTEKNIDIIGVGSLIPLKNYDLFLEVIRELSKEKPLRVVLIGDGTLRTSLQQKIKTLELENIVSLKGSLGYEETQSYMAKAKILLHTSEYESFGLVFPEALQFQTGIVSRPVGCYFASPNWLVAETKSEFVAACRVLLSQDFDTQIQNPFLIHKTVEAYYKLYHE